MAEIAEMITDLRGLQVLTKDSLEEAKITLKGLSDRAGSMKGLFDQMESEISISNDVLKVGEHSLDSLVEDILSKGDLKGVFEKLGLDVQGVDEASSVFKRLTADLPERKLYELNLEKELDTRSLNDIENELEEIDENPSNIEKNKRVIESSSKLKTFEEVLTALRKTANTIIISGIVIALGVSLAEYIKNYIRAKSGAFLVTSTNGTLTEEKITNYSCIYPDGATIDHPFNNEILKYLKNTKICSEVHQYGNCAGWASLSPNSRLAEAKIDVTKLGKNKTR